MFMQIHALNLWSWGNLRWSDFVNFWTHISGSDAMRWPKSSSSPHSQCQFHRLIILMYQKRIENPHVQSTACASLFTPGKRLTTDWALDAPMLRTVESPAMEASRIATRSLVMTSQLTMSCPICPLTCPIASYIVSWKFDQGVMSNMSEWSRSCARAERQTQMKSKTFQYSRK